MRVTIRILNISRPIFGTAAQKCTDPVSGLLNRAGASGIGDFVVPKRTRTDSIADVQIGRPRASRI